MKVVIFGTGKYYQNRKMDIAQDTEIITFIDNNQELAGQYLDGVQINLPKDLSAFSYDKILLMSVSAYEMRKQLLDMGVDSSRIWYWEQYRSAVRHGTFNFYCGNECIVESSKKILIISDVLDYNGGTLAAVYAAKTLQERGYNVVLASCKGASKFIDEMVKERINIAIVPSFPYLQKEELYWVKQFDAVIVNEFQMINAVCQASKIIPTLWWIHEPSDMYQNVLDKFEDCVDNKALNLVNIMAVSSIPKHNFNTYFPDRIKQTLQYGIPDENEHGVVRKCKDSEIVFAVVGGVVERKAQDIFIRAANMLEDEEKRDAQFWIIGFIGTDKYSNEIRNLAANDPRIKIWGELTREEIREVYQDIDVVVCPSREDPLPIVMTEGMMYGKVCLTSDANGTIDYIEDSKNGFICKVEDANSLSKKMQWIIRHKTELHKIQKNARKTYEENFTLEKFGERLEIVLLDTIRNYNG